MGRTCWAFHQIETWSKHVGSFLTPWICHSVSLWAVKCYEPQCLVFERMKTVSLMFGVDCSVSSTHRQTFPAVHSFTTFLTPTADFTIFVTWMWNLVVFVWLCLLCSCGPVVALVGPHLATLQWSGFAVGKPSSRRLVCVVVSSSESSVRTTHHALIIPLLNPSVSPVVWRKISESKELRHVGPVGFLHVQLLTDSHTTAEMLLCKEH